VYMSHSRKILVLVPPLLIGFTILMVVFVVRHVKNQQGEHLPPDLQSSTTTSKFEVIKELPPATKPSPADSAQTEPSDSTNPSNTVACTLEAKVCADGSAVGRTGPNCEFALCPEEQPQAIDLKSCPPESRQVDACVELYAPVCAAVSVQCVTTPCNPVPQTYSNSCFACVNENVVGYSEGACST
jgi:hypothetical protein